MDKTILQDYIDACELVKETDKDPGTHLRVAGAAMIARQCAEMMVAQNILADLSM